MDCYLLLRPVLLVGAARHVYISNCNKYHGYTNSNTSRHASGMEEYCDENVARLPTRKHLQLTDSKDSAINSTSTSQSVSVSNSTNNKPIPEVNAATNNTPTNNSTQKAPPAPTSNSQDSLSLLQAIVNASPRRSLFSSWKSWLVFALLDVLVVFLSKLIKRKRMPVVYISEKSATVALSSEKSEVAKAQLLQNNDNSFATMANGSQSHIASAASENSLHTNSSVSS